MIDKSALPNHVALIMDGNRRWAKKHSLPQTSGHKEGLTVAKNIVKAASELGIKYVTLYTFSTENWKRTEEEVGYLMNLIKSHLRKEFDFYKQNGIKIRHIGNINALPSDVQDEIINAQKDTVHFTGTTVVLAINYGGRDEIIRAVKKFSKNASIDELSEENLSAFFDVEDLPEVDLIIRTGGEQRISNFLLWQAAYAEFLFTKTLWPDYNKDEFLKNIETFQNRNRRFGGI